MDEVATSEQLAKRNRELEVLNDIAAALNRSVDLRTAMNSALALTAELLNLNSGWIWLLDAAGEPGLAAAHNLPPFLTAKPQRMRGRCWCLDEFVAGEMSDPTNVEVRECSRLRGAVGGHEGLQYHASVPLYVQGRPIGLMNVASSDWCILSADDLRTLYTIGYQLAIAIERARLYEDSHRQGSLTERSRLAREYHDTLAQALTAVTLYLETADALVEKRPDRAHEQLRRAIQLTRNSLEETRRAVRDLRAAPLENRTLAEALAELCAAFADSSGIELACDVALPATPLRPNIEAGIYRIVQESLNNVQKHAEATHVNIALAYENNAIRLLVQDDGKGFDPTALTEAGHFGLIGLGERARLLGGSLEVASSPGAGTRIEVTVPND